MFDPIVIPIRPVFVSPGIQPITSIEVPFPVEPCGEYIEPSDAAIAALAERVRAFDVLNETVFHHIVHYLLLFNRYEPGWLNRHSADHCLATAVVCANCPRSYQGKDYSEWLRWLEFVQHADPFAGKVLQEELA